MSKSNLHSKGRLTTAPVNGQNSQDGKSGQNLYISGLPFLLLIVRRFARYIGRFRLLTVFVLGLMFVGMLDQLYPLNLPKNNNLFARVVVDENNRPLRTFADPNGIWRYPIELSDVSPLYIEALLTYEDRWFWLHPGINPFAVLRATYQNLTNGRIVSGGSTISMQVARILHPHNRSFTGKLQQVLRTLQLEWHLSKNQILQIYLNTAPFGGTIEGVEAASYTYLNKSANDLTHSEAALLAVLPQAPTRFRPDIHNDAAQRARDKVLKRLVKFGVWSQDVVDDAMLEQVYSFNFKPKQLAPLLARRLLAFSDGQSVVKSTINSDLQQSLQDAISSYMSDMPKQSSAAILVVDNKTSAVKAYIGTVDFANEDNFGYVDMVQATRSPGSTLKPFLYGMAMDEGLIHSHSLLADVPRNWGNYRPGNFNGTFNGPVTAEEALQRSLNMPAVDLLERLGVNRFAARLENAGLALVIPNNKPNLSMILGGVGSSLEQLVESYTALANQGNVSELRYLTDELTQPKVTKQMLSPSSAWIIQNTLSDIDRPDSIQSTASIIENSPLAWKTGTSYGFRDSWAIGVNNDYTIGVWIGRPDGTPMPGHFGRKTAGPLLFMAADQLAGGLGVNTAIAFDSESQQPYLSGGSASGGTSISAKGSADPNSNSVTDDRLSQPETVTQQTICWPLGVAKDDKNADFCHQQYKAWVIDNVVPPTWHVADADTWQSGLFTYWVNPVTEQRVTMDCNVSNKQVEQVAVWPKVVEPWLNAKYRRAAVIPRLDPQCINSEITASASLKITGIDNNSVFRKAGQNGKHPSVWLKSLGGSGNRVWYINGKYKYKTGPNTSVEHVFTGTGKQQIVVQDELGNTDVVEVFVQ
ncbi:penicillin-binding protein 1C [Psychrosphaera sp. 1_MG-2023]|uniref:penicillin-binding protein 1C n=1 Tax=Psychrosphaera sp. 1_MG-2023 TaxID=3062643 RepID=UPI0026E3D6B3|nr:penicillin-binding protein 1C [Psychrosphaera sp. 1_MG-2023]MDO6720954.1 penicillin-binding protein 1C [Psychrosphaera sp. 1_MG-2023]